MGRTAFLMNFFVGFCRYEMMCKGMEAFSMRVCERDVSRNGKGIDLVILMI